MGRTILGILAGMVTAWLLIMVCQFASGMLYPPPPGMDLTQPDQLAAFIANNTLIPHPLWMTVLGVLLPLPAAWLGARMARRPATATP